MVIRVDPSGPTTRKVLKMESKEEFLMDMAASAGIRSGLSAASVLENQGSEDSSSRDGSLPSCSSASSERISSADLIDGAAEAIATLENGEVRAMLQDADVRAVLRKVTINEGVLNKAIQSLGGGEKGLQSLMGYIMVWVKQQRDIQPSSQQPPPLPPSAPAWNFSTAQDVFLQPNSDAFQILGGNPPSTQLLDREVRSTRRMKSRKLMTGESEMGALEPTPAMATKAARRHRMSRQRQSFHARAASPVATDPFSVGGGSLWNTNAVTSPAVTSSGLSGAHTPSPRARVVAAREGRSMECLTVLLQKELRPSDVSHIGRVILPKKEAEQHLPSLATGGGVSIEMEDFDSGHAWNLRYRFWPNNKSRMYVLENTAAFVMSHGLVEGDLLVIYRVLRGGYVVRGMKKKNGRLDHIEPVQVDFAYSSARGSLEGQRSLHESGTLVQRLYGCCPSDKSVKEEPVNLEDDPYLNDVILSMGPSFESDSSCIQKLEQFPSLTVDFPFEEIMAVTRTAGWKMTTDQPSGSKSSLCVGARDSLRMSQRSQHTN